MAHEKAALAGAATKDGTAMNRISTSTVWQTFFASAIAPHAPPSRPIWDQLIATEPRLAHLERRINEVSPPADIAGYWHTWRAFELSLGRIIRTGLRYREAYLVARDHLHRLYTDRAVDVSGGKGR